MRCRRHTVLLSLVCAAVLNGCTSASLVTRSPIHATASPVSRPVAVVTAPPIVRAIAQTFIDQFAAGEFAAQWPELSPVAQATWPSEAARAGMLAAKFAGHALSAALGTPLLTPLWTEPEDPAVQIADVWTVPVRMTFRAPQTLRPLGVAGLFSMTPLVVATGVSAGASIV